MGRFATLIGALVLVVAACGGSATTAPTPAPVTPTPTPTATPAPAVPTPAATRVTISTTVTWDGDQCTYAGPAAVPYMATVEFAMTNTHETDFTDLYVGPVIEGTTWEQVVEWAKSPDEVEPTFFPSFDEFHWLTPGEAESTPLTAVITRRLPYLVLCSRGPETPAGGLLAPAAMLSVLEG